MRMFQTLRQAGHLLFPWWETPTQDGRECGSRWLSHVHNLHAHILPLHTQQLVGSVTPTVMDILNRYVFCISKQFKVGRAGWWVTSH